MNNANYEAEICVNAVRSAYDKGYEDGKKSNMLKAERNGYRKGLVVAWECAKKLIAVKYGMAHDVYDATMILNKYSVAEALDFLEKLESGQSDNDCHKCANSTNIPNCVTCEGKNHYKEKTQVAETKEKCETAEDAELCADYECGYNHDGRCGNDMKCEDFKPVEPKVKVTAFDEIYSEMTHSRAIVTSIRWDGKWECISPKGQFMLDFDKQKFWVRTGRHFADLEELMMRQLEQMIMEDSVNDD